MRATYRHLDERIEVDLQRLDPGRFRASVNGQTREVQAEFLNPSTLRLTIDGHPHTARIARVGRTYHIAIAGAVYVITHGSEGETGSRRAGGPPPPRITAPMPGKILQVLVGEGDKVAAGDGLLIVEAMKMENRIVAEAPGTVRVIHVTQGQTVDGGQVMIELEYAADAPGGVDAQESAS